MNDISRLKNVVSLTTVAVEKQCEVVTNAEKEVDLARNAYLKSIVHAASISEKIRRKNDFLINIVVWGGSIFLGLILLLINIVVGIVFFVGFAIAIYLVVRKTIDQKRANYNNRKAFFNKYSQVISTEDNLSWKGGLVGTGISPTTLTALEWVCPKCATDNSSRTNFCSKCGTKKP